MRHVSITLTVLLIIVGCAPATIEALRENHANKLSFDVKENYQPVFRKVLKTARKCFQTGLITAQMVVQGELYQDIETGTITVAIHGGLGVDTHLAVDVTAIDEDNSKVTVFNALSSWNRSSQLVREWVLENSAECEAKRG